MISLTTFEDTTMWINPKHIIALERQDDRTLISMTNGQSFWVKETPQDIICKMGEEC
jgi:uncharacterized protein YlzI (FlbEa/FlbD family)